VGILSTRRPCEIAEWLQPLRCIVEKIEIAGQTLCIERHTERDASSDIAVASGAAVRR